MKIQEFIDQIIAEFGFPPTHDQLHALETFGRFLADRDQRSVMIMRGSAGTGKTSLAGAYLSSFRAETAAYGANRQSGKSFLT